FLKHLQQVLPTGRQIFVVTDAGFGRSWFEDATACGLHFIGRLTRNNTIRPHDAQALRACDLFPRARVKPRSLGRCGVTWHHPIEIVDPIRNLEANLPEILTKNAAAADPVWAGGADLREVLLGEDPIAILGALEDALLAGAAPEKLARHVAHGASLRLARFALSNEVTDWFGPQHTLNFANAVHQAVCRTATPDTVRGIFQAAIALYVDRYLNVPAARLPGTLDDLPENADDLRETLLSLLDQRSEIDAAAAIVSRYVRLGHPIEPLIDTLTFAAVREDIDFHSLQVIEASARQCAAWGEGPEIEEILVGAVRNLAAHCPTRRAGQQTAQIALRLHRGDAIFEEEAEETR
ncbi:MAG: hypothetical protein VCC19_07850, partial [Myxococcota bacterium]